MVKNEGQALKRPLAMWCFVDAPGAGNPFDASSVSTSPGRWNHDGEQLLYASERYATAMLEKLAHCGHEAPSDTIAAMARAPAGCSVETVTEESLPGWADGGHVTQQFGSAWIRERRSLLLIVPSIVARRERNVLVNPAHPEFARIEAGPPEAVIWDPRLFG